MKKTVTIIECLILLIGVLISLSGTFNAVKVSASYIPCFLFAVMGIVFITALIRNINEISAVMMGFGFIVIYLIMAGFGYIICFAAAA
jgi:hypothetical protein